MRWRSAAACDHGCWITTTTVIVWRGLVIATAWPSAYRMRSGVAGVASTAVTLSLERRVIEAWRHKRAVAFEAVELTATGSTSIASVVAVLALGARPTAGKLGWRRIMRRTRGGRYSLAQWRNGCIKKIQASPPQAGGSRR